MFNFPDRCIPLREEAVNKKEYMKFYYAQRNVYFNMGKALAEKAGKTPTEAISAGLVYTLSKFTPVIIPNELIVGFNFGEGERSEYFVPENNEFGRLVCKENGISAEDMELFFTPGNNSPVIANIPPKLELTTQEAQSDWEWAAIGRCIDSNHTVLGYEQVLKKGFSGLLAEVEAARKEKGDLPIYSAMAEICSAACAMGEKYAGKATELLNSDAEGYNKKDLEFIISVCSNVPKNPARSFAEAVQSLWFAHIINTWEDNINANSIGRLDQILYPYYSADIEKGILTREKAFEIICCLWLKLYRDYDVQQSCVGGTDEHGNEAVNELSYMMLDATEQLNFIRCLSVRYSSKTDKAFLRRALEVVGHVQKGVPFFFNDDVMIPALVYKGIPLADSRGYTQIGCVETVIPGKSNPHAVTGEVNLLKAIEYVLCNGKSMAHPEYFPGLQTGETESFKTYESFYAAVLTQIGHMLDLSCSKIRKFRDGAVKTSPRPYKSLLTEGCVASGRDFNDAGALYDYYQVMLCGIPNLADSLAVIRKFVYEDKKYTLSELKDILEKNFPDESVRTEFINKAPKYGNDDDSVDLIAAEITNLACDNLDQLSLKYGLSFHAQPFTFLWMIDHGNHSAASPDGRHLGDPIAYSCSAMQGRDFNGLTALFNSISKLPGKRTPGTTSAIVELDPKLFCDENIEILTQIFAAASSRGLCNVQFNITDAETLTDAQKHPEHYNNLAVRVSGFSQKFNLLSTELQNHIIGRTKHTCL
ncbi:MAG: hypothetical protein IIX84_03345 [Oscillospiraceae bacterium]|nr:hypothetical protein [Oscillospiraceae bacterium]